MLKEGQPLVSIREAPIELRFTEQQTLYRNRYYRNAPKLMVRMDVPYNALLMTHGEKSND